MVHSPEACNGRDLDSIQVSHSGGSTSLSKPSPAVSMQVTDRMLESEGQPGLKFRDSDLEDQRLNHCAKCSGLVSFLKHTKSKRVFPMCICRYLYALEKMPESICNELNITIRGRGKKIFLKFSARKCVYMLLDFKNCRVFFMCSQNNLSIILLFKQQLPGSTQAQT